MHSSADDVSAWSRVFTIHGDTEGPIHVGAELTDGTYVSGTLLSYADDLPEGPDRELVLVAPIDLRTKDGKTHTLGCSFTILSARQIIRLDVTHLTTARNPDDGCAGVPAKV
jgi:hypothetical protein